MEDKEQQCCCCPTPESNNDNDGNEEADDAAVVDTKAECCSQWYVDAMGCLSGFAYPDGSSSLRGRRDEMGNASHVDTAPQRDIVYILYFTDATIKYEFEQPAVNPLLIRCGKD